MAKRGRLHLGTWLACWIVGGAAILTLGGPPGFIFRTVHQLLAPFGSDDPWSGLQGLKCVYSWISNVRGTSNTA